MELDIKFQEPAEAVESANLNLNIAKSMLRAELKKGEGNNTPPPAGRQRKQGYG